MRNEERERRKKEREKAKLCQGRRRERKRKRERKCGKSEEFIEVGKRRCRECIERGEDRTKLENSRGSTAIKVKLYKSASREWRVLRVRQPRNNCRERESCNSPSSLFLFRSLRPGPSPLWQREMLANKISHI